MILGRNSVTVTKRAVAARPGGPPTAMFSIGSRLASLDGGLANSLLSALLGSRVSLTVMDYLLWRTRRSIFCSFRTLLRPNWA